MNRSSSIRKSVVIFIGVVTFTICWNLLSTSSSQNDLDQIENEPDFGFKPHSCVVTDGKCKPFGSSGAGVPPFAGKGLYAYKDTFYLDGQLFRILSGSFHYFRMQPAQWGDRLLRMKAAGLNTVTTYVAWNVHEKVHQIYRFGGKYDIASFIQQAQKVGLYVIVRAGPYICAEWEFGGLPSWLLHDNNVRFRTSSYPPYLKHIEEYFSKLLPILAKYTHKRGGPIIAFQIENEFGSLHHPDPMYLKFLYDLHKKFGIDEFFITSDGSSDMPYGSTPEALTTVNFANNPERHIAKLKKFQPNKPLMVTEFWSGWFDHWGEKHHFFQGKDFKQKLEFLLINNVSVNFYMFVGSTNFGFYNGANNGSIYQPTVTSYDYNAPIAEHGDITTKFQIIRRAISKFQLAPIDLPDIPENPAKANYGNVELSMSMCYTDMIPIIESIHGKIVMDNPISMESLDINNNGGQGYGYILYRCVFAKGSVLKISGEIHDRAQVIVNRKQVAIIDYHQNPNKQINLQTLSLKDFGNELEIFVENMGRVNYKSGSDMPDLFERQRKGITGTISVDGRILNNIEHIPFEFNEEFRSRLASSSNWKSERGSALPTAFKGILEITGSPKDTFIDTSAWNKGIILINGYNIGRYWNVGPQTTLYVPAPLLTEGTNQILVFELHTPASHIHFTDKPHLG